MSFQSIAAVRRSRAFHFGSVCAVLWACSIDDRYPSALGGAGPGGGGSDVSGTAPVVAGNAGTTASGGSTAGESAALEGGALAELGGSGGSGGSMGVGAVNAGANVDAGPPLDAPPAEAEPLPPFTGELTTSFARAKVEDGTFHLIVQNNIWAEPGVQRIAYSGATFQVLEQSGVVTNGNPVAFPSIYMGRHGDQEGGAMTTSEGDNLPIQVSQIIQIRSLLSHNAVGRDANAVFECWFAPAPPVGEYFSASAYLSVWLWQPPGRLPIGTLVASNVNIGLHTWDIFVGLRDGAPAISYLVSDSPFAGEEYLNLAQHIRDAQARGSIDGSSYLTDIIAGFEVWSGGAGLEAMRVLIGVTG